MTIITGISHELSTNFLSKISTYRHRVFVEMLGWDLPCQNGMELDQFDRPDTLYVVSQDDTGSVNGCARLLPTDRPYLLGEVFPQLMNGRTPPCSPDVWELSRFAAVDFSNQMSASSPSWSSDITIELFFESIACAARHGAKHVISISPIAIERLLRRHRIPSHRVGPPVLIDGHPIIACWIDVAAHMKVRAQADF